MSETTDETASGSDGREALVAAGAAAITGYLKDRGVEAVTSGDGRFTVYVGIEDGSDERLQVSLASTPGTGGILARVQARRRVNREDWPKVLVIANEWNRRNPSPRAALAQRGQAERVVGVILLEAWLPATATYPPDQVRRFVDSVIGGARRFWSSGAIRELAEGPPPAA